MELPRPSLVKQLSLYLSPEGKGFAYLLADHTTGSVLRLSRAAAMSFQRFSRAALGDLAARSLMSEDDAKTGFMTLQMTSQIRRTTQHGPQWFNPLSIHWEMVDVGPFQRHLTRLADAVFGPLGLGIVMVLALAAFLLGLRNDWSAATAFQSSMTIEALLTFGLFAPFLKLIHELGHVLAATKYGVRVRMGGVNLIGFYPLPFVDCSHADLSAQRSQRIMISAAGVLTDFAIGLTAFCLWHVVEAQQAQDILGYIFVFSTLNSVLFNANPLMRLDGYFVVFDALGRRNFGTDAALVQKDATAYVGTLGAKGNVPQNRTDWAMLAYGLASSVYKVVLLLGIMWIVLPQFFGIGVIAVAWAFWAMFGAKWMGLANAPARAAAAPAAAGQSLANTGTLRRAVMQKWLIATVLIGGLLMLPIAPRAIIDLRPDLVNAYNITNTRPGVLELDLPRHGYVMRGDVLARLRSADFADATQLADLAVAEAQIINAIAQGAGAAQIKAGADRLAGAEALRIIAQQEAAELTVRAPMQGIFTADSPLTRGSYLAQGSVIGSILPQKGDVWLTGIFPETHVIHFDRGVTKAQLWTGGQTAEKGHQPAYQRINPAAIALIEEVKQDVATLSRGFTLRLTTNSAVFLNYPQVKLTFKTIPLWQHVYLWCMRKVAQFRDAQLAENEKRIEN